MKEWKSSGEIDAVVGAALAIIGVGVALAIRGVGVTLAVRRVGARASRPPVSHLCPEIS